MRPWTSLLTLILLAAPAAAAPKLTVLIAVDQLRADYLDRFRPLFGAGGFERLRKEGREFREARYEHQTTYTGPGHSLLGSGQYGRVTGIVGNGWFDRKTGQEVYCVEDAGAKPSAEGAEPASPRNFGGQSLARRVKAKYPEGKVVGVALKDRSAILMVGPGADAAYWFDKKTQGWISVDYYAYSKKALKANKHLPDILEEHGNWTYDLVKPMSEVCPAHQDAEVAKANELPAFPHKASKASDLRTHPGGHVMTAEFAKTVIKTHRLGRDAVPDVLAVSFSATDYIGHLYGPDSCETADAMAKLDKVIADFLAFLDDEVGKGETLVLLSSDHGVAPLTEVAVKQGHIAARVFANTGKAKTLGELPAFRQDIEKAFAENAGREFDAKAPLSDGVILAFSNPGFYLNTALLEKNDMAAPLVRAWLKEYLLGRDAVKDAFTADELELGEAPEHVKNSFRKDRSGDVVVQLKPYHFFSAYPNGTTHGQFYDYDRHVPVLVWGQGVEAGEQNQPVRVAQVAPTLAQALGLAMDAFSFPTPLPLATPK